MVVSIVDSLACNLLGGGEVDEFKNAVGGSGQYLATYWDTIG